MNRNRSFGSRVTDTAYRGMNGLEMKELLDRLEKKFYDWYNRSLYELSFEVIRPFIAEIDRGKYMSRLDEVKVQLYLGYQPKDDDPDPDRTHLPIARYALSYRLFFSAL